MPYADHFLVQFGGRIGAVGGEIWSCGIRIKLQNDSPLADFNPEEYLDDNAVPALSAWIARATSKISSGTFLEFVKCNQIGPDGRYVDGAVTHERFLAVPVAGGAGSGTLPWQACVVLSWETNAATRGPASKGRIYSPTPTVSVNASTGLFVAGDALGMAQSAATLLNTLDDSVGVSGQIRPHIMSEVGGAFNEINRVRVDNRVDVQRRRANQVVPLSSVVPFSY